MIKNNIAKIRSKKGYSIRKLAMKTGMSKSMIFRLENSQTSLDLKRLEKLAIALDCRITDLFDSEYK
ncbi:helix-turn-helix domain-containing protein [Intestinibacter sp.]|uniref:helix-turn-helix domain-containing protein n=1 Tax=Intestinibacter sp. TaxID=1965304 RepID=UPI002A7478BD|nr:helix-turn-helix transcriptional regulator [Intestinibacter sp.]MDY2737384.1 helix-turn-helix transcriptional regulator [Intestinibacter sp.]